MTLRLCAGPGSFSKHSGSSLKGVGKDLIRSAMCAGSSVRSGWNEIILVKGFAQTWAIVSARETLPSCYHECDSCQVLAQPMGPRYLPLAKRWSCAKLALAWQLFIHCTGYLIV